MPRSDLLRHPQPALGLLAAAGGWMLSHQLGSDWTFDDCATGNGLMVVLVSLLGLLITVLGGLYCLSAWRAPEGSGRRFLGVVGAGIALAAGFAILLQIAAGLILPPCAA